MIDEKAIDAAVSAYLSATEDQLGLRACLAAALSATSPAAEIAGTVGATRELRFVFDAFPSPEGPRFIEVEDENGCSLNAGEWRKREDGLVELVVRPSALSANGGK